MYTVRWGFGQDATEPCHAWLRWLKLLVPWLVCWWTGAALPEGGLQVVEVLAMAGELVVLGDVCTYSGASRRSIVCYVGGSKGEPV